MLKRRSYLLQNSFGKRRKLNEKIASCIPQHSQPSYLQMKVGSFYLPKENPKKPLGEDAHVYNEKYNTIALVDGVGGWARRGIDSGKYARALMENALFALGNQSVGSVDPKQVLKEAFLNTKVEGSSTACIITLKEDFLFATNLGDSGFLVIRDGGVVYKSPVQLHGFNFPYQIGNKTQETPNSAQEIVFPLLPGDVIVAGTDGLFDNVYPAEIEGVVELCLTQESPPGLMASTIGELARQRSLNRDNISPFTRAAVEAGNDCLDFLGGKYDDVTVVVAYIRDRQDADDDMVFSDCDSADDDTVFSDSDSMELEVLL